MQVAKPVIKWAGGKGYLLNRLAEIIEKIDASRYEYCEPMVGGGAIYYRFHQDFKGATISDANPDLINLYKVIQTNVDALLEELTGGEYFYVHKSEPATLENYRRIRASDPVGPVQRAARILFLLKTCFNGLMRVNKAGRFNVPPGSYQDPVVCDEVVLRAASVVFAGTNIVGPCDAAELIRGATGGRFLGVDPPYHMVDGKKKFVGYSGEFGDEEQENLVGAILGSGCPFVYMNRATDFIVSLFDGSGATLEYVPLRHSIQPRYTTGLVERELIAYR